MSEEEFDSLQVGDWVKSAPYDCLGFIARKMPDFVNIEWADLQQGVLLRDSWQRERLWKVSGEDSHG